MALGAWFTDLIHLHAVFGAFVIGATIPKGEISEGLINKIQPLCVAFIAAMFFTYSGLNTRIDLLNNLQLWLMCGLVARCCAWQRRCLYAGGEGIRLANSRRHGDRDADEFARLDGIDHHQHRTAAWNHHA